MKRGLILSALVMAVLAVSASMHAGEKVMAEPVEVTCQPVMVPYTNMTVEQAQSIKEYRESYQAETCTNVLKCAGVYVQEVPEEEPEGSNELEPDSETLEPELVYLGTWTTTGYCACSECCGEWATGCTASGVLATSEHTVACGILPFGTRIVIDGIIYTVEDTGVEGEWVDIFFDSHEEALNYGMHEKEVYLLND